MKAKDYKKLFVKAVKTFKENKIESLCVLLPVLTVGISLVIYTIEYIMFILNHGYKEQIEVLKIKGIDGIEQALTFGDYGSFIENIDLWIVGLFVITGFCLIMYKIINELEPRKRKLIIINIIVIIAVSILYLLINGINQRKISLIEAQEKAIINLLYTVNIKGVPLVYLVFITFIVISVGILLYYIFRSVYKHLMKIICLSGVISLLGIPILFILLKNIIPLIFGIVSLVIIGGILIFVMYMVVSGISSEERSVQTNSSSRSTTSESKSKEKHQKKKEYKLDTVFWRDKGGNGIVIPEADCIYMKNAWGEKTFVCTVRDYENGDVAIINKNARIMNIAGCKAPVR